MEARSPRGRKGIHVHTVRLRRGVMRKGGTLSLLFMVWNVLCEIGGGAIVERPASVNILGQVTGSVVLRASWWISTSAWRWPYVTTKVRSSKSWLHNSRWGTIHTIHLVHKIRWDTWRSSGHDRWNSISWSRWDTGWWHSGNMSLSRMTAKSKRGCPRRSSVHLSLGRGG